MDAEPTGIEAPTVASLTPLRPPRPPGRQPLRRTLFDVAFGIVLPLVCFACDPVVFVDDPLISLGYWHYRVLAWTFAGVQMLALGAALAGGRRPPGESAILAGVLGAGAIFAGAVGIAILPISLLGLIVIVGVIGFVPFATAFAYARAAARALREAAGCRWRALVAAASLLVAIAVPVGVQAAADTMVSAWIRTAVERPVEPPDDALLLAARVAPRSVEELVWRHAVARDEAERLRIARLYLRLAGEPLRQRRSED